MIQRTLAACATVLMLFMMPCPVLAVPVQWDATSQLANGSWRQYSSPQDAGYSTEKIAEARRYAEEAGSAAVFVVDRGNVVIAWGDIERPFKCHSVRKSFLSALYGPYVTDDTIRLETTIDELGIDDINPLTDSEKQARIVDLLRARSGIYHKAAKEVRGTDDERPKRGSHAPDSFFYYNNWDFNTLGVIFEQLTHKKIFEEFQTRFANPLGMEDFKLEDMHYELEPSRSRHPAYAFRLSARDSARFGLLFANEGRWNGRSIVPKSWVEESTSMHSDLGIGRGYGYMWWVYPAGSWGEDTDRPTLNKFDKFAAVGAGGQIILVIPKANFVYVHRADTDNDRRVSGGPIWQLAEMILAARTEAPKPNPNLVGVSAQPLPGALPAPPKHSSIEIRRSLLDDYVGTYEVTSDITVRVFIYEDRLFANLTGAGEAEFVPASETRFFVRNDPVQLEFFRDDSGSVSRLVIEAPGQKVPARRIN